MACWDGYKQVGMKKKGNKMVPNCVPVGEEMDPRDHYPDLRIVENEGVRNG